MKKKINRKFSAQKVSNIILLTFTIISLLFYPYHETLWGGLIFSFASAGLIGGIADWFAIKSFFTKPLGISWPKALFKIEMIPRNREQVISVIVDIVQDKIITKDALTEKIKNIEVSKLLIDYVVEHRLLNSIAEDIISKININSIKNNQPHFKKLVMQSIDQNRNEIYNAANHLADWAISKGYVHSILNSVAKELQKLLKLPEVSGKLNELFSNIKIRYNNENNLLTKVATYIFSTFNDIPKELIEIANNRLELVKDPEFIKKYDLSKHIQQFAKYSALSSLSNFIKTIDIKAIYDEVATTKLEDGAPANTTQSIVYNSIDKLNSTLKENTALRNKLIAELDIRLSEFFYEKIEYIIKNKLAEYSNEMLTEEIYNSVGEDLNMIRINGSLVGGMVGVITFIIMYIAG